jgi:magnesium-transporting ATPase (P-type)
MLVVCHISRIINIYKFDEVDNINWFKCVLIFFKIFVSRAVAAIPKDLAAVATATRSVGTNQTEKSNANEAGLNAIETEGYTFVIWFSTK